ncbi:MAG: aldo/keto reductase [Phycisphaerae bacterium]
MIYRTLGRTGLKVSQLGFGAMRLPMKGEGKAAVVDRDLAIPMIHRAFEAGVNYIDSAVGYCNEDSQRAVGEALKGWREKIVLSTKNHYYGDNEQEWWKHLEDSLSRLQVSRIDIYNHHGIRGARYDEIVKPVMSKWMRKARDQGLIKHICCSFHDDNAALMKLVDTDYVDVITLQYNIMDRQLEEGIAYAHAKGIGIVVMGPVGGGRLGADSEILSQILPPNVRRIPELAMRFVLANPNVAIALSGMSTMQQVEENIATCSDATALSEVDKAAIDEQLTRLSRMAELYCTGCGYCMPCPRKIDIPQLFKVFNHARVYGLWPHARKHYASIQTKARAGKGAAADACTECGACEDKCPQNLPIRKQLKEVHQNLAQQPAPKA